MPVSRQIVNENSVQSAPPRLGLLRKSAVVGLMTLLSRVLGFVRDIVLASLFGAGGSLDAFLIAFKIPNFFRRLFGEGAFSQAFVPVLSEFKQQADHASVLAFVSRVFTHLALALLLLVAVGEVLAPALVMLFAPGFLQDPGRMMWAVHMLRVTFPYILLISLTAMSGAVLNTHQRFMLPAFAPVLLNIALIWAAWRWSHHFSVPIYALSWGVIVGGVLQLLIQWPVLSQLKLMPTFSWCWRDPQVQKVLRLMVPALFGVSVAQVSLMIDNAFASFLPAGSISWLYYSDRLTYLPLGVIGVALATVVLPTLSRQHQQQPEQYSATLSWALRLVLFFGVPAGLALMIIAKPVLATLFLHGHFLVHDVIMTQHALIAFAFGLPAFMAIKILASAFYAKQNIKTPVKVAAFALLINVIGNVILIHFLQHAGLALSTSIAAYFNVLSLYFLLLRKKMLLQQRWRWFMARLVLANSTMAVLLWYCMHGQTFWLHAAFSIKVLHLIGLLFVGVASYVSCMWLLGWRPRELRSPV